MPFDLRPGRSGTSGPLQGLDARLKLIATLLFIVAVVVTPIGRFRLFAFEGLALSFMIGLAGIPPGDLFRRWFGFLVLIGFLAAAVAQTHPARDSLGFLEIWFTVLARNSLALGAITVLAWVTPFHALIDALRKLGTPRLLVSTLHFMCRYAYVLDDEAGRMAKARRCRTFRSSKLPEWTMLSSLIGMLFLRAHERGERVHSAMLARGWDGVSRSLDDPA